MCSTIFLFGNKNLCKSMRANYTQNPFIPTQIFEHSVCIWKVNGQLGKNSPSQIKCIFLHKPIILKEIKLADAHSHFCIYIHYVNLILLQFNSPSLKLKGAKNMASWWPITVPLNGTISMYQRTEWHDYLVTLQYVCFKNLDSVLGIIVL